MDDHALCKYPGCSRPRAPRTGGRPPMYCDDPQHNRKTSFDALKALGRGEVAPAAAAGSAANAGERLEWVAERLVPLLERHRAEVDGLITAALSALDDLDDTVLVQADLERVRTESALHRAEADLEVRRAQQAQQTAEATTSRVLLESESAVEDARQEAVAATSKALQAAAEAEKATRAMLEAQGDADEARRDLLKARAQVRQNRRDNGRKRRETALTGVRRPPARRRRRHPSAV